MRAAAADTFEALTPPQRMTLEEALEFASEDECVEVTPNEIRIRKVVLNAHDRAKIAAQKKRAKQG